MSTAPEAERLLELLGERRVRQILAATSREALSVSELSEECDVALSTIYRRVDDMVANDLLVEKTAIEADGSHHSVYKANVDHLAVDIDNGEIDVTIHLDEDAAQRFSRVWRDIREA